MNVTELEKLTVVQLREQLKTRGLGTAGNKTVLIQRLTESFNSEEKILQSESAAFDDDQDLEQIAEEDVLGIEMPTVKAKKTTASDVKQQPKILKPTDETKQSPTQASLRARITLTSTTGELDSAERKLERAKKFNVPLSGDDAKDQRAIRFGLTTTGANGNAALKKRAERFGIPVSGGDSKTATIEELESKKEQRAKRFQIASAAATVSDETLLKRKQRFGDSVGTDDEIKIKQKKRIERFGLQP